MIFDPAAAHMHDSAWRSRYITVIVLEEVDGHTRGKDCCRFVRGRVRRVNNLGQDSDHAAAEISPVVAKNHSVQHFTLTGR
jgi:hypothetical protein